MCGLVQAKALMDKLQKTVSSEGRFKNLRETLKKWDLWITPMSIIRRLKRAFIDGIYFCTLFSQLQPPLCSISGNVPDRFGLYWGGNAEFHRGGTCKLLQNEDGGCTHAHMNARCKQWWADDRNALVVCFRYRTSSERSDSSSRLRTE